MNSIGALPLGALILAALGIVINLLPEKYKKTAQVIVLVLLIFYIGFAYAKLNA